MRRAAPFSVLAQFPALIVLVYGLWQGQIEWRLLGLLVACGLIALALVTVIIWRIVRHGGRAIVHPRPHADGDLKNVEHDDSPDADTGTDTAPPPPGCEGNTHLDALTGLLNRCGFRRALVQRMGELDRASPDSPAADGDESGGGMLAIIDGNDFSSYHRQHGHAEGDRLLRDTAHRIKAAIRIDDIAARWGRHEFVVFFPDANDSDARQIVGRLQASLREDPAAVLDGLPASISAGFARLRSNSTQALDHALQEADRQLYYLKRQQAG